MFQKLTDFKNIISYITIVVITLFVIGAGIHNKAYQAVAPPIHDPISYYSKSQIVWDAIRKHEWKSAFNQFPQRPPGTALILYPFGFMPSIQSFLFRSTITPIVIWAMALALILLPLTKNTNEVLYAAVLTISLLSLPIFYHFEFPCNPERSVGVNVQWGLVDVLEGSIGALSIAFLYTGLRRNISLLVVFAWIIAAFTLFIKPSGILIIGSIMLIYITEIFILCKNELAYNKKTILSFIICFGSGILIAFLSIYLAISSGYLSSEIVKNAVIGQKILIQMEHIPILSQISALFLNMFGNWWVFIVAILYVIITAISIYCLCLKQFTVFTPRIMTSFIIFSASLYWWVNMAGEEHRYMFPFVILLISWLLVPTLFEWMISLGSRLRYMVIAYCLVPLICIIALLNIQQGKVSSEIERFFGYNLDTGQYQNEVKMGNYLLQEATSLERALRIYTIGNYRVGAVEMIDWVNSIEHEGQAHHFTIYRVNDWVHPGIKMKQLLSCDYFIIEKSYLDQVPSAQNDAKRWQDEESFLVNFIKSFTQQPDSAIRLIQDGPVSLYKVQNREKYVAACNDWVANHKWNDDFWFRNSYARCDFEMPGLKVIDHKVMDDLLSKTASVLPVIDFGHKMTLLALLRSAENDALKSGEVLFTFLFRADQEISSKYAIFIHLMDKDEKVIFQHDFQIDPDGGIITKGKIWKSLITISESELSKTYSIGFGAYIPNKDGSFLQSDCRSSDWNGNRVILNLKP